MPHATYGNKLISNVYHTKQKIVKKIAATCSKIDLKEGDCVCDDKYNAIRAHKINSESIVLSKATSIDI